MAGCFESGNKPSCFIKCGGCRDCVRKYWFLRKDYSYSNLLVQFRIHIWM